MNFKENNILKIFGNNIRKIREDKHISLEELANMSGICKKYLNKIENGEATRVNTKHLYLLTKALKIKINTLFKVSRNGN